MLLLSGLRDEVVPKEHMASLWEIVGKRQGVKADDTEGGSPRKGDGQVGQGRSKFVTFERGSHSEFRFILVLSVMEQGAHDLWGRRYLRTGRVLDHCRRVRCESGRFRWS